ncbi:MAG: bacteriohemerythrin [Burkholderiaceae bacterium]|nr:bacteriohemerythrin [Burkholderiaceae bacterium]
MPLEWKDAYRLGHAELDSQHEHLFQMVNLLENAHTAQEIKPLLMQLFKHTREHFELEESEMRKAGFPEWRQHVEYHNRLLSRLTELGAAVGKGQVDKSAITKLMSDWALRHIRYDDAMAAEYIARAQ